MTTGRSTPNKLTALDRALVIELDALGCWTRARIARAFGISGQRVTQLCASDYAHALRRRVA